MDNIMDQLLAENTFHCTHCKNLLRIPVMLVEEKGNMCYACYEEYRGGNNVVALENTALFNILKKIKIPCEYKSQGCDQKLRYEDFYTHKDQCIHQSVGCNIASDCPWGSFDELITYYEENHKDRVLTSSDDCYKLFEIQDIREGFYVLKTSRGTFILNMRKIANRLQTLIYDSNKCGKNSQYSVIIKFVTDGGDKYQKKCVATKNFESFILFNDSSLVNINLEHIREFLGEDTKVEVIIGSVDYSKILEEMQEKLICSRCKEYIKSNAYTCAKGHNICVFCQKDSYCRLCREAVTKNALLENLAILTRFPCRFKKVGCKVNFAANSNHEDTCDFNIRPCFVAGCDSSLSYPDLILHAVNDHAILSGFTGLSNLSLYKFFSGQRGLPKCY